MADMTERTPVELREAYLELAMGEGYPDPQILDELVRLYPQYAQELTSFAIDLAIEGLVADEDSFVAVSDEAIDVEGATALSAFQNALFHARRDQAAAVANGIGADAVENPFSRLDRAGMRAVAEGLGSNSTFVLKLRDRVILADTLSHGFVRRVAELLEKPFDLVLRHFQAGQTVGLRGQSFKADDKPVLGGKQTFEESLTTSGLSSEQQKRLRSL
ncbi:hypothetical protein EOA27_01775 [Mesorhizobium sp. M2A.F.Ca.ET.037.01.1.1]|uniref:hypothetical protein n=1 Tax=unclassified Mesorhizobium TaxID=325217 RepID=UPI000FCB2DCC|nr:MULTISPECIES: hypothetical protein [unclassified Mesorhizobium]RUX23020.1 hypothetical protein EOA27_01775 [Mesorhizobium sp. M2A.F.Ca.ET.037.01.1.1]RUY12165.1 hypothetical protein EOA25_04075 [Mesorhizobium sp. M2A.F.Ca.ET.040.01.1.1]RWA91618.1 MAG: hypothetical protein EOQ31_10915 [Mesorhizobium sp.]TIV14632.1 MAG: hypothetical protein E5V95_29605 [Mesorhizobium sp.]